MTIRPPLCIDCLFFYSLNHDGFKCKAYPAGIPEDIINGETKHTQHIPGDRGYYFVPFYIIGNEQMNEGQIKKYKKKLDEFGYSRPMYEFIRSAGGTIVAQCMDCKNLKTGSAACKVYKKIPKKILRNDIQCKKMESKK